MEQSMGWVEVSLTRGKVALVDVDDAPIINSYAWHAHRRNLWYARTRIGERRVSMHSLITGWPLVDHVNGDGLDNRRSNLRQADRWQNQWNQGKRPGGQSRFKGVNRTGYGWRAEITVRGRRIRVCVRDEESAARAYDELAREHFGEFARLNFPRPGERSAI